MKKALPNRIFALVILWISGSNSAFAQTTQAFSYVNPFIGTTKTNVLTKWGSEGGTYPGAVAPFGYVQLSPETRVATAKGYDFSDSTLYFFSCLHHSSGFPNGSAGRVFVMPVEPAATFRLREYYRRFSHQNEHAQPGYYRVQFDDGTIVEATAAERSGMFRFIFPAQMTPKIFVGDAGTITSKSKQVIQGSEFHSLMQFSEEYTVKEEMAGGSVFRFAASAQPKVILLRLSASGLGLASAQRNLDVELARFTFDQVREKTRQKWEKELAVVDVEDSSEANKTIFYTALYHSLLMPWIISDVDGKYQGHDGKMHQTNGKNQYGGFSPWDTFRTLHPLLSLLFPERQTDMVASLLDIFKQTGHLPIESMTGNHAIPILVDSHRKGIVFDSTLAYKAMIASLVTPPFIQPDMEMYQQKGYIPFSYPESVTRTLEYAYDDWVLAQFAGLVMRQEKEGAALQQRSYNYRNLFNAQELFFLPRQNAEFKLQPGTTGYKEGDKWVYTYFVPHQPKELVNLLGGAALFADRLDSALSSQALVFDNETLFHVPYLFNYARRPDLTQKWVRETMQSRFSATPGGLPGNDDLGSMSSWYVFSAMGLFPVCPGRPAYAVGSPMFRSLTVHLAKGKTFVIKSPQSSAANRFVKSVSLNNQPYTQLEVPHTVLSRGGEVVFETNSVPSRWGDPFDEKIAPPNSSEPDFEIISHSVCNKQVKPNEQFWVRFVLRNSGVLGTKVVQLRVNGREYSRKNCLVAMNQTIADSIPCRLYSLGKAKISVEQATDLEVEVSASPQPISEQIEITHLRLQPVIRQGDQQSISYTAQNIGGISHTFYVPVKLNESIIGVDTLLLQPGEKKQPEQRTRISQTGVQIIRAKEAREQFKAFQAFTEATILDLSLTQLIGDSVVPDHSGFANDGKIIRTNQTKKGNQLLLLEKDCFVEVPSSPSLDELGETITMMAWVYPTEGNTSMADLLTKGDHHVLQVVGQRLNFFAGGWGRGECSVDLPSDWRAHWHHIAGVCNGKNLQLYVDGELKSTTNLEERANLSVPSKWTLGRNEEFPSERIFQGYMDNVKVFTQALSIADIKFIVQAEKKALRIPRLHR